MPVNTQTSGFPGIQQPEISWENNLAAISQRLNRPAGPFAGGGLVLSVPASGLVPTITDGYVIDGDRIAGPFASKLIGGAPVNADRQRLVFGLKGLSYPSVASPETPKDVLIGEVSTTASDVFQTTQYLFLRPGVAIVRSFLDLGKLVAGKRNANIKFAEIPKPAGYRFMRVPFSFVRINTVLGGTIDAGDALDIKGSTAGVAIATIGSLNNAALAGAVGAVTELAAKPLYLPTDTALSLHYNLTDANSTITSGVVEIEAFVEFF
jgi:hypothetical protein